MNMYSHKGIKSVYVIGDCHCNITTFFRVIKNGLLIKDEDKSSPHPKEIEWQAKKASKAHYGFNNPIDELRRELRSLYPKTPKISNSMNAFCNSVFIVSGDCGFGFNELKYYENFLAKYNKILCYNNSYVYFIRGNHDDPSYFDGKTINFSNIKAIPDYSVISAASHNILCVGGGLSIDREWRKEQEKRINRFSNSHKKRLYWNDEMPVFNFDKIKEICKSIKIDCVVTHTAPSFVYPQNNPGLDDWAEKDTTLFNDAKEERITMDKIFEALRDNGSAPVYWAYGHFSMPYADKRSSTIFRSLGNDLLTDISTSIKSFEAHEAVLKKKMKKSGFKSLKKIDEDTNDFGENEEERRGVFDELNFNTFNFDRMYTIDEIQQNARLRYGIINAVDEEPVIEVPAAIHVTDAPLIEDPAIMAATAAPIIHQ